MNPYLGIGLLALFSVGFAATMLFLASVLGPKNKSETKQLPFECGAVSVGAASEQRFGVRFYLIAVLFLLFDVEVVFMYPWAVTIRQTGWFGFAEMLSFVVVLSVGLYYVWRKGVFNWN